MDKLLKRMKALNEAMEELEAKRADEKDAEKAAVIAEMLEAKASEFAKLETEVDVIQAKEKREKMIADMEKKSGEIESKKEKLSEVEVPSSKHNKVSGQRKLDAASCDYLTNPDGAKTALAKMDGQVLDALRPEGKDARGLIAPSWLREVACPQATGSDLLGKHRIWGKTEYEVLTSDASGSQSGGASLVPDTFIPELYKIPQKLDDLPNRCWVKRGVGGSALFPKLTQSSSEPFGVTVTWGDEGAAMTESDPVFSQVSVSTSRLSCLSYMSLKELRTNAVGVEGQLAWMYRGAISRTISNKILEGSGSSQPTGVNLSASITNGVVNTGRETADQVSFTDMSALQFAVAEGVMDEGVYILSGGASGAAKYICGLDDTYGRPVMSREDTWAGGKIPVIAGRPYIVTAANTANLGNRGDVIYGDFRQYGLVIDTDNMAIDRSDDYAFNLGQVAYRVILYVGGQPLGYTCFSVLGDSSAESSSSSST